MLQGGGLQCVDCRSVKQRMLRTALQHCTSLEPFFCRLIKTSCSEGGVGDIWRHTPVTPCTGMTRRVLTAGVTVVTVVTVVTSRNSCGEEGR